MSADLRTARLPWPAEDHVCAVCGRSATGIGVHSPHGRAIAWTCDDPDCLALARDAFTYRQRFFSVRESLAAQAGGQAGGDYLEQIGKTDLATLSIDEWCEFNRRIIGGYRAALKTALRASKKDEEAPF